MRVRTWITIGALTAVVTAGCLPPGTPTVVSAMDGVGTVAGVVTVRTTPIGLTPTSVTVRLDSPTGALLGTDTSAPFEVDVDTTSLANGPHTFVTTATDGTKHISDTLAVTVDNRVADWTAVDAIARARVAALGLPGAALRVVHHGAVVHDAAFGSYTADTRIPIASASKWLTAAAIMNLVEAGALRLDAPISQYLPQFTGAKARITLRQLLAFTSGLRPDPICTSHASFTLASCTDWIASRPLAAPVGTQFRYGSGHLVVAARIAEVVTGRPWVTVFYEQVARPTGLGSTFFAGGANPNPAGSALSSLSDYTRFLRMIWNRGVIDGRRVLAASSVAEMERDQTNGAAMVGASPHRKDLGSRYGLGEWYDALGPAPGAYEVNSPGAFGFHPWLDRSRDVYGVYAVLDQAQDAEAGSGGWQVKQAVRAAIDGAGPSG
jgi:CubicO group peptidase (beta-lactamase class C family)